ncbi:SUMF1/EgtB/PvdO family nonheme iron enzyme [Alkalinema sp. FACHB-956]|uniref:caspase, EACC1-associated type n=1 Tax=Alkalinema sp. FACHB-956 TaxID=2692768 RepID=UPI0016848D6D|nr:SUMF1/EgtB/PvdO family nonheme iron enzyme [Alkalinema sp. FACHB-956]MBD2329703.1 SUMF1/EgtB/PvdO family nonheme iron enzyme [Alkalinema sp. FACHB-956]
MGKYALLIGVSEYPEGLGNLPAAANDVQAVQAVLSDRERGEFDDVQVLVNPGLEEMQSAIEMLFADRSAEDLLLLYFSGHGLTDGMGKFFFATPTTRKQNGVLMRSSAIAAGLVHEFMQDCPSERQVVILDCCHSGAFGAGLMARDGGDIDFQLQLGGKGRVVLTASAAIDYSFERSGEELAIYTRYLVEGLRTGAADRDGDGWVSVDELHEYVKDQLRKAAPNMSPQRYLVQDGEKIRLAKAGVVDPQRQYRKEVERYSQDGEIRPAGRWILRLKQQALGLEDAAAREVEAEVLQPYVEHRQKVQEYEDCLREEVALQFPLGERAWQELRDLQKILNLSEADVVAVQGRVLPEMPTNPEIVIEVVREAQQEVKVESSSLLIPFTFTTAKLIVEKNGKIKINQSQGSGQQFIETLADGTTLELVQVPGGSFQMGSDEYDSEKPIHGVKVPAFLMGKYPITQAQWKAIAQLPKVNRDLDLDPADFKGHDRPVEKVSWWSAIEACDRLSQATQRTYRLPTEAEWEYACRAGTTTPFYFGETISTDLANYDGNHTYGKGQKGQYREQTTPVGTFPANGWGLCDLHGNVWEWCLDHWHDNYKGAPQDGSAWLDRNAEENAYRILRGGSWFSLPIYCRSSYRRWDPAGDFSNYVGFRVVLVGFPGL